MVKVFDSPLAVILAGYTGVGLIGLASCLVGASVYDLKEAKTRHSIKLHPHSRLNRHRSSIAIVIYVSEKNYSLISSLESIRRSSYRNYEITVIDDTCNGDRFIQQDILKFTNKYPKTTLHLLRRRKKTTRAAAIKAGIKKSSTTELILHLNAGDLLERHALFNINQHFRDEKISTVTPALLLVTTNTVLSLYQEIEQLVSGSSKKLISLARLNNFSMATGVSFRRKKGLGKSSVPPTVGSKYASDVMVHTLPPTKWSDMVQNSYFQQKLSLLFWQRLPNDKPVEVRGSKRRVTGKMILISVRVLFKAQILLTPLIISYLLYLAVNFKQSALFGLSWIIFSVVLMGIIWSKDQLGIFKRTQLTVLMPVMYPLFYLRSIIQLLVLVALTSSIYIRGIFRTRNKSLHPVYN